MSGAAAARVTAPFLAYFNGKSAGRLAESSLRPCGVHHFASDSGHPKEARAQFISSRALLLHFPFCHYDVWRHKFNILDSSQLADWGFYRESRLMIAKVTKAAAAAAKSTGDAGDGGEGELQRFYCKHVMLTDVPEAAAPSATGAVVESAMANEPRVASSGGGDDQAAKRDDGPRAAASCFDDVAEHALLRKPSERAVAVTLPPEAQMQCWRNGIYVLVQSDDSKARYIESERVRVRGSCDRRGSFPAETRAGGGRGGRRGVKAQMPLRHLSRHICRARTANPPMRSATPATDDRPRAIVRERNPRPRAPTRSSIGSPRKVSFCWMSGERHLAA